MAAVSCRRGHSVDAILRCSFNHSEACAAVGLLFLVYGGCLPRTSCFRPEISLNLGSSAIDRETLVSLTTVVAIFCCHPLQLLQEFLSFHPEFIRIWVRLRMIGRHVVSTVDCNDGYVPTLGWHEEDDRISTVVDGVIWEYMMMRGAICR